MTNASASTAANVNSARTNCRPVSFTALKNCDGFKPTIGAATMAAKRHAVPAADSHWKVNTAAYGADFSTTGGTRSTRLCKPGQLIRIFWAFSFALKAGQLHNRTITTSDI